jgi:hypothetical protein
MAKVYEKAIRRGAGSFGSLRTSSVVGAIGRSARSVGHRFITAIANSLPVSFAWKRWISCFALKKMMGRLAEEPV